LRSGRKLGYEAKNEVLQMKVSVREKMGSLLGAIRRASGEPAPEAAVEVLPDENGMYEHECLRCGHKWRSRRKLPGHCPDCTTVLWNTPRKYKPSKKRKKRRLAKKKEYRTVTCAKCGHSWRTALAEPPYCPACHSRLWTGRAPKPRPTTYKKKSASRAAAGKKKSRSRKKK